MERQQQVAAGTNLRQCASSLAVQARVSLRPCPIPIPGTSFSPSTLTLSNPTSTNHTMESERPKHQTMRSRMPESQNMNASRRIFTELAFFYPSFLVPHLSDGSREFLTCIFMGILLILMFLWGLTKILYVPHSHNKLGLLGGMDG